jgi:hypothetical protein|tara:strand:- start:1989 stop:2138 length:150 start_codon:yes stop_codon:yes gene_type:complete
MKYILLALLLVSCATTPTTFIMPAVDTPPEERKVLVAVPVIPVDITSLN